jgi:hypothetical protein
MRLGFGSISALAATTQNALRAGGSSPILPLLMSGRAIWAYKNFFGTFFLLNFHLNYYITL